jgi:hypothetical protein
MRKFLNMGTPLIEVQRYPPYDYLTHFFRVNVPLGKSCSSRRNITLLKSPLINIGLSGLFDLSKLLKMVFFSPLKGQIFKN